jgi:hypothetical protein
MRFKWSADALETMVSTSRRREQTMYIDRWLTARTAELDIAHRLTEETAAHYWVMNLLGRLMSEQLSDADSVRDVAAEEREALVAQAAREDKLVEQQRARE